MIFGDSDTIITIISRIKYSYKDVSIRYEFSLSDGSLTFYLQLGDKAITYPIPRYDLVSLKPDDLYEKLNDLVKHEFNCKKEEDMTVNLGTVDTLATKINAKVFDTLASPLTTDYIPGRGSAKSTKALIDNIVINLSVKRAFSPKKIIKSGPCTIVIWEDNTKTIVRLREGEKDDEFAAFSAAVVKKLYGSNSAVTKMIKKKTFVQEKKED